MTIDEERPPLTLPEYRAVKYSIRDLGQGRWRWALHRRRSEPGGFFREITAGEVSGTREDAFAALTRTIDLAIGGQPHAGPALYNTSGTNSGIVRNKGARSRPADAHRISD